MKKLFDSVVHKTHNKAFGLGRIQYLMFFLKFHKALNYCAPGKNLQKPKEPLAFQKALSS